ncbi:MAG: PTS sugar transporter subunit IIA [Verrucomicrobiota bacterium]
MNTADRRGVIAFLSPAAINLNLTGSDRESVLSELVNLVPGLTDPQQKQTLLKALLDREQLHSTGIGDGVALPHCRNALVGLVDHPILVFGRHPAGIAYGSIDNAPAKLFFLLVAPTVTEHLALLARLGRLLRDPKTRQELLAAATPDAALATIKKAEGRM